MGIVRAKAEVKEEAGDNSIKVETSIKAEKVEGNIKNEGDNYKELITQKVEVKRELSTLSPMTEHGTIITNVPAPAPEVKDESSSNLIKTEDAEYEVEEKKSDILVKAEASMLEIKDGEDDDVPTKSSVLAGIKRENPEDSDEKSEVSSRAKRARRRREA